MAEKRTFEQVLVELINLMDNPVEGFITDAEKREVSDGLSKVRGLPEFLRSTLGADMRRYFSATPEEQERIKGAFQRTIYILGMTVPEKNFQFMKDNIAGKVNSK